MVRHKIWIRYVSIVSLTNYQQIVVLMIISSVYLEYARRELYQVWSDVLSRMKKVVGDKTDPHRVVLQQCINQLDFYPVNDYIIWWCTSQIEIFCALLALCAGTSPVTGEFPSQSPETRSVDNFLDLRLHKRLSKQLWRRLFEMPSRSLWRQCNDSITFPCSFS